LDCFIKTLCKNHKKATYDFLAFSEGSIGNGFFLSGDRLSARD
jgi:hypothetical protein